MTAYEHGAPQGRPRSVSGLPRSPRTHPSSRLCAFLGGAWLAAGLFTTMAFASGTVEIEPLVDGLIELVRGNYVLPGRVESIEKQLRQSVRNGRYGTAPDPHELSNRIMADLRDSSGDLHFGIRPKPVSTAPPSIPETGSQPAPGEASPVRQPQVSGLGRAETMPDEVGYIEIRAFPDPMLGGAAIDEAFAHLANSRAMILDLRQSRGGHPGMVAYLLSYFFDGEPFLFNRLEWPNSEKVIEFETLADLPSPRFADRPVFILTSRATPSAAEGFSYHMKHLGRARIVGEATAGAAHLTQMFELSGFLIAIPTGRPISPVTGGNWEGTGVVPDHEVSAGQALELALELAAESRKGLEGSRAAHSSPDV